MSSYLGSPRSRARAVPFAVQLALLLVASLHPGPAFSADSGSTTVSRRLADRVSFGAYVDRMQEEPARLSEFEQMIGGQTDVASYYYGYGDVFPGATELNFANGGRRRVLVAWDMGPSRFNTWTAGRHNAYLHRLVAAFKAYPYALYVRPWPEMNGDWQAFQPTRAGTKPAGGTWTEFKRAWRYVVTYFRVRGVTNVRWVFNPTADVYAGTTRVDKIWPGDAYVDVLGLDGFNWGEDSGWGRWRTFSGIFLEQYRRLTSLSPRDPVWICEVASKEPREADGAPVDPQHSKAAWISGMLGTNAFGRIRTLIWFHADKERDWRVNSSQEALTALRNGLGNTTP